MLHQGVIILICLLQKFNSFFRLSLLYRHIFLCLCLSVCFCPSDCCLFGCDIFCPFENFHQNEYRPTHNTLLYQRQILGTGNLPQDSAPVCINIDISLEISAQRVQRNQAFCVTASDWSPITSA